MDCEERDQLTQDHAEALAAWNKLDQTADPVVDGAEEWDESRRLRDRKRVALARSRATEEALERHVVGHGCGPK